MEFKPYDPKAIEPKWQKRWADSHVFEAKTDYTMPKFYGLIEFPYPSGQGLHVGHPRSNTAMDIIARKRRMEGYNVLFPIGWDAFGLPTENYAIKNKVHPAIVTKKNIDHFREQLQKIGFSFDYSRVVKTRTFSPGTVRAKSTSAPTLRPIQLRCCTFTLSMKSTVSKPSSSFWA